MDDKLREAITKKMQSAEYEHFTKAFRKVFGITPDVDDFTDGVFTAHGERWALDAENALLWNDNGVWSTATLEALSKSRGV